MARDLPRFPDDPDEPGRRPSDEPPTGDRRGEDRADSPADPADVGGPRDDAADRPVVRGADDASGSAEDPRGADDAAAAPQPEQRTYWTEVSRVLVLLDDDLDPPPRKRPVWEAPTDTAVDRSDDPEGSWRGESNRYLPPERNAAVADVVSRVRDWEDGLTNELRDRAELNLESGGYLVALEYRLKGDDGIKEKIAEELQEDPARSAEQIVAKIPDVIRYTFQFRTDDYVRGYHEVTGRMEDLGYEQVKVKNSWGSPDYKGINTRWVSSDGQLFEVQFHTEESFHAKHEVTHTAYERLRNPLTSKEERDKLMTFQREVSSWISIPDGVDRIPNHTKEGY